MSERQGTVFGEVRLLYNTTINIKFLSTGMFHLTLVNQFDEWARRMWLSCFNATQNDNATAT